MSGPREKLQAHADHEEVTDEREVFLRDGRKLVVSDQGADQMVEIRNESGMLELRIVLTEQGPVLQMEAVRLQLKATESIAIESPQVDITATSIAVKAEADIDIEATGETRVKGKKIHLN